MSCTKNLKNNLGSERTFRYGDPESAREAAPRCIAVKVRYPRNSCTPMETYGVLAEYDPHGTGYDIQANFQGPFSIHPVIARALKVPGSKLRLRTAEFRRQFWGQAGSIPLYRSDGCLRPHRGPPREVDRRPS